MAGKHSAIVETNTLYKKIAAFDGDSIAAGSVEAAPAGWAGRICPDNRMPYTSYADGGATIAAETYYENGSSRHWLCRSVASMRADADYIILEGGRNDFAIGVPLGAIAAGYTDALDDTTFCGGFESMLRQAVAKYPGKRIGYIVCYKTENEFYPYGAESPAAEVYYGKAKELCNKYSIPYLDLFNVSGLNVQIASAKAALFADGVHINAAGYDATRHTVEMWMKSL